MTSALVLMVHRSLHFQTPISPLESKLLDSYNERQALKQHRNAAHP